MKKTSIIGFVAAVAIIAAGVYFLAFNKKQDNTNSEYAKYDNTGYGFSLEYPKTWHTTGAQATSTVISFSDAPPQTGENRESPGAVIDIMIIENYDNISLEEWINESLGLGPELNILNEETVDANNTQFAVKTFVPLHGPEDIVPTVAAYTAVADDAYFAQINYMGQEPNYTAGMKYFKHLLSSFKLAPASISIDVGVAPAPEEETEGEASTTINVVLQIDDKNYQVDVVASTTVFDLMQTLKEKQGLTWGAKEYPGMGFLIEEINGVKSTANKFWVYYINGQSAQVGASQYVLQPNDKIEWKYESAK